MFILNAIMVYITKYLIEILRLIGALIRISLDKTDL